MASELITGFAGVPHVGSDDMGAFQAGILGVGSYVLQTGQQLKATVASANKVTIGTGDLVMNGRHVRMATATDLTIQNGAQGQKRNDLIVCRYSKASDGKETATLVVVKGTATTGTPADPSYNKTSILDGASVSDMPLYRIPIANLSVGTPVQLFKVLTPLDTVGDSVTQMMEGGTLNVTPSALGASYIKFAHPHDAPPLAVTATIAKWSGDEDRGRYIIPTVWDTTSEGFQLRFYRRDIGDWAGNFQCSVSWIAVWAA